MAIKHTAAIAATALVLAGALPVFAQQGTTLAGPAQGEKADGSSSTVPSAASGASGGARDGSTAGTLATGTVGGGATAPGGGASGSTGRK